METTKECRVLFSTNPGRSNLKIAVVWPFTCKDRSTHSPQRYPTEKNGRGKTTKMYFTVILRAIPHKVGTKKQIIGAESTRFNIINQRLTNQDKIHVYPQQADS